MKRIWKICRSESDNGKVLILGFAMVVFAFIAAIALTTLGKWLIKLIVGLIK